MKNIFLSLLFCFQFFIVSKSFSFFGQGKVEIKNQNVCTECVTFIQNLIGPVNFAVSAGSEVDSILISTTNSHISQIEKTAFAIIRNRASKSSAFAESLISHALNNPAIKYKLYYQLSVGPTGRISRYETRSRPLWETEKEIPHEMWGFYQVQNQSAYVLINEYQNMFNADYTLVHELFHLLDKVSMNYVREFVSKDPLNKETLKYHALDDLALEIRSILSEVQYRKEMKANPLFKFDIMAKTDFRDKLNSIEDVINYTLDIFYPIRFKNQTTKNIKFNTNESDQRDHIQAWLKLLSDFFEKFTSANEKIESFVKSLISGFKKPEDVPENTRQAYVDALRELIQLETNKELNRNNAQELQITELRYEHVNTTDVAERNKKIRNEIYDEAKKRGGIGGGIKGLVDYLQKTKLLEPISSESIRQDQKINIFPGKRGGPSPRTGDGAG